MQQPLTDRLHHTQPRPRRRTADDLLADRPHRPTRPTGQRVPNRRASKLEQLTIEIDTRERYPYKFAGRPVERQPTALPIGDYAVRHGEDLVAVVERKTPEDFNKSL